jgi:hypothetical protein
MIEENKKYRIAFAAHEPDKFVSGKRGDMMGKVYFSKDTVCFDSRAELMEFFDNPEKIFKHLRNAEILKMILDKNSKGKKVVPLVEIMPYMQGDGTRLYFDERREVEIAVEGNKDNKVHNGNIVDSSHQKLFIDGDKEGEWDFQPIKV